MGSEPPEPVGPDGTTQLHEDDLVRVWEVVHEPGERLALHSHEPPYVVVCIEAGEHRVIDADGQVTESGDRPGDVAVRSPGVHELVNVGRTRYRNRLIELKTAAS